MTSNILQDVLRDVGLDFLILIAPFVILLPLLLWRVGRTPRDLRGRDPWANLITGVWFLFLGAGFAMANILPRLPQVPAVTPLKWPTVMDMILFTFVGGVHIGRALLLWELRRWEQRRAAEQ